MYASLVLKEGYSDQDCIAKTKPDVVVAIIRRVVVTISATQVGWFVVP